MIFTRTDQLGPIEQLITTLPEAQFIIQPLLKLAVKSNSCCNTLMFGCNIPQRRITNQTTQLFLDLSDPIDEDVQSQLQTFGKSFLAISRPDYVNEHVEMM